MKQTIKRLTMAFAGLVMALGLTFTSCKKAEKGEAGPTGATGATGANGQAGPQAKTFNFNLTFNPGDNYKSYSGITGFDADDVVMFYLKYEVINTLDYYSPLPLIDGAINYIPDFSEATGKVYINTLKADGTAGSPFTAIKTVSFKAVLIKSSQRLAYPNLNLFDYKAVKKAYNLED